VGFPLTLALNLRAISIMDDNGDKRLTKEELKLVKLKQEDEMATNF